MINEARSSQQSVCICVKLGIEIARRPCYNRGVHTGQRWELYSRPFFAACARALGSFPRLPVHAVFHVKHNWRGVGTVRRVLYVEQN